MQHKKRVNKRNLPLKKQEDSLLMLRKYLGGEPFAEIARSYKITPSAVAKRIRTYLERVLDFNQVDLSVVGGSKVAKDSAAYGRYLFDTLSYKSEVLLLLENYLKGESPKVAPSLDEHMEVMSVKQFLLSLLDRQGINEDQAQDLLMFCSRELSKIEQPLSVSLEKPLHQMDLLKVCRMAFIVGKEVADFQKK